MNRSGANILLIAAAAGLAVSAASAQTVVNPSFEDPNVADGGTGSPSGYGLVGGSAAGVFDPTGGHYSGADGDNAPLSAPAEGGQVAFINDNAGAGGSGEAFLFQNFEGRTVAQNEQFTLTVAIGNRADLVMDTFAIRLITYGGTVIAESTGDAETFAPSGSFADAVATSLPGAGFGDPGAPGGVQGLQLQLVNTNLKSLDPNTSAGIQVNFDHVRLTSTIVPEPAALGLLGVSTLGLLARRRKA